MAGMACQLWMDTKGVDLNYSVAVGGISAAEKFLTRRLPCLFNHLDTLSLT
jgi:hypothetical protein